MKILERDIIEEAMIAELLGEPGMQYIMEEINDPESILDLARKCVDIGRKLEAGNEDAE